MKSARAHKRDALQHRPRGILSCLLHHRRLRARPQGPQDIELRVQSFSPESGSAIRELGEPALAVVGVVDRRAAGRNAPGPEQRLEAEHHPGRVLHQAPPSTAQLGAPKRAITKLTPKTTNRDGMIHSVT